MGLDMELYGEESVSSRWDKKPVYENGLILSKKVFEIGYWRKHPNLHGYIVDTFANGEDNCQRIELDKENIKDIIAAIENDELPHNVTGFFFGKSYHPGEKDEFSSYEKQKENDLHIFNTALAWLEQRKANDGDFVWKSIYYQASW